MTGSDRQNAGTPYRLTWRGLAWLLIIPVSFLGALTGAVVDYAATDGNVFEAFGVINLFGVQLIYTPGIIAACGVVLPVLALLLFRHDLPEEVRIGNAE